MHILVGEDVDIRAELVDLGSLRVREARLVRYQDAIYDIELEAEPDGDPLARGTRAVLNLQTQPPRRVVTTVQEASGRHLRLRERSHVEPEKRTWPRLHGGVPLRYRAADAAEASRWMAGEAVGGRWGEPDPFMSFSVTGVSFDDVTDVEQGGLVILELGVGDAPGRWRATADVVRATPLPQPGQKRLALDFRELPEPARDALTQQTLRIQRALLAGDPSHDSIEISVDGAID
jgi:hypothetical protein